MDLRGLHIAAVGAGIADMRIRQRNDLTTVRWVCENLLIPGHRGIEDDLADRLAVGSDRGTFEDRTILKCKYCRRLQERPSTRKTNTRPHEDQRVCRYRCEMGSDMRLLQMHKSGRTWPSARTLR